MLDPFLPSIRKALCKLNKEKEFEFIEYLIKNMEKVGLRYLRFLDQSPSITV